MELNTWQNECLDLHEVVDMLNACIKTVNKFEDAPDKKPILVNIQRALDAAENAEGKRKLPKVD